MRDLTGKRVRITDNKTSCKGIVGILKFKDGCAYAFEADEEHEALHNCVGKVANRKGRWLLKVTLK